MSRSPLDAGSTGKRTVQHRTSTHDGSPQAISLARRETSQKNLYGSPRSSKRSASARWATCSKSKSNNSAQSPC
jgi:hypothetical protein